MRKIVILNAGGKDKKIGICTQGIVLSYHPAFRDHIRRLSRWMVYNEVVLKRKRVK